jgi:hypothetical protein
MNTNQSQTLISRLKDGIQYIGLTNNQNGQWMKGELQLTERQVGTLLETWILEVEHGKRASLDLIRRNLEILSITTKHEAFLNCRSKLQFDPTATNTIDELIAIICGQNLSTQQKLYYGPTLLHAIWNSKRALFGLKRDNPILLNFYGQGGAGKNEFLKLLASPLDRDLWSEVSNAKSLFNDPREQGAFYQNYIIILPELAGMESAHLEHVKSIIDVEEVCHRIMQTNDFTKKPNRATLFGSSNTHIKNIMSAELNMRKMAEINFVNYSTIEDRKRYLFDPINNFDFVNLWKSVNENAASPIAHYYSDWIRWTQSVCLKPTPTQRWFYEFIQENQNQLKSYTEIELDYLRYANSNSIKEEHRKKRNGLVEFLLNQGCKKECRKANKMVYSIPSIERCAALINGEDEYE